uniref:Uncharacterized protein n=1 Tax=viral metagenome TaxID=1070528 RepID=A0A6M3KPQ1_9ZZZZ
MLYQGYEIYSIQELFSEKPTYVIKKNGNKMMTYVYEYSIPPHADVYKCRRGYKIRWSAFYVDTRKELIPQLIDRFN